MEKDTTTQVVKDERLAFFNLGNLITINTFNIENDSIENHCELFIVTDLIKAMILRNELTIAINDYLETIKELDENN
jgi:hypothetical protein